MVNREWWLTFVGLPIYRPGPAADNYDLPFTIYHSRLLNDNERATRDPELRRDGGDQAAARVRDARTPALRAAARRDGRQGRAQVRRRRRGFGERAGELPQGEAGERAPFERDAPRV